MTSPSSHGYKIDGGLYFGNIFMAHKLLLNWLTQTMTECVATSPIKVPGWVRKSVVAFVSCLTVVHFEIILCTQPGSLLPWPGVGHERIPSVMLSDSWLSLLHRGLLFAPSGRAPFPAFVRKSMNNWSPRAKPVLSPASSRYLRGAGAASPSVNYTWEAHYPGKGTCWHCKWLGPALPAQGVREGSFPQERTLYIPLPVPRHTTFTSAAEEQTSFKHARFGFQAFTCCWLSRLDPQEQLHQERASDSL